VLASVPTNNLGAEVIRESNGGIAVEPGQTEEWLASARQLAHNSDLRREFGRQARAYAEGAFDIERITDKFEALITRSESN
jgi:glycosyltransferase involved in cell wall biosynthesis